MAERAERFRARMALKASKVESEVQRGQPALVEFSGVARAALLLHLDQRELRRNMRMAAGWPSGLLVRVSVR